MFIVINMILVCCVYFRLLLNEYNALIKIGDVALAAEICSLGVRLFYTLMNEYTVLKTCTPIDKFISAMLQSIGIVCLTVFFFLIAICQYNELLYVFRFLL